MRINIYSQEIDLDRPPEIVHKDGVGENGPETFYGVRFWLRVTDYLHHSPDDDDTSAVTFWLPKSDVNMRKLATLFMDASVDIRKLLF